ncbi:hypothetical protein BC938DRAFT_479327 [Jimgerdemannia flammicorona]|nr:hypothetical protein BC938DRAFT_479327 [Jimgerdemannia flammicorona]
MTSTSTRTLHRLPPSLALTPSQLSRLSALSIQTTKDLFSRTELELVELCDWDPAAVHNVVRRVARWIAPAAANVRIVLPLAVCDMYHAADANAAKPAFLKTGLDALDELLGGGLPCSTVTEIVGPSGCGKTQFCLTLTVLAASTMLLQATDAVSAEDVQETSGVIYIDTEGVFSSQR